MTYLTVDDVKDRFIPCTPNQYKQAMRQFPAAVSIIATGTSGNRVGMTATAVCSLTAEPPQIIVCLNRQAGTARAIQKNSYFSINTLGDRQADLARRFAGMNSSTFGDERFEDDAWATGQTGIPVLRDAVIVLECRLVASYEIDTHIVAIGAGYNVWNDQNCATLIYQDGWFGEWAPLRQRWGMSSCISADADRNRCY